MLIALAAASLTRDLMLSHYHTITLSHCHALCQCSLSLAALREDQKTRALECDHLGSAAGERERGQSKEGIRRLRLLRGRRRVHSWGHIEVVDHSEIGQRVWFAIGQALSNEVR